MQPAIRYVRAADGVRIAYWALGEGTPLVVMPSTPFSHVQLEWDLPECRDWYQRLMAGRQLVRYDARGFGLSDRNAEDYSLDANILDLEAVAARLGPGAFALFASGDMGMTAVAFAARHPERVSHLVLWCSWARRADISQTPHTKTLRALVEMDWETYTETTARMLLGWESRQAQGFAAFYRECTSPEVLRRCVPAVYSWDVTPLLPQVTAPVLVLQRREMPAPTVSVAGDLAAGFQDSQLAVLEGRSPFPWGGDMSACLRAVRDFLGDRDDREPVERPRGRGSVTILFTDMESSTPLTSRLGDEGAQELVRAHNRIVREALNRHRGTEIKHTGDGIMASFASATAGLECAIDIQRLVAARNDEADVGFRVRIGLNAGEPVAEESDLFGTAVQLAARIRDHAQAGEILVSNVVRELVAGKGFLFSDRGHAALKGFDEPARIFEVHWQE